MEVPNLLYNFTAVIMLVQCMYIHVTIVKWKRLTMLSLWLCLCRSVPSQHWDGCRFGIEVKPPELSCACTYSHLQYQLA